MIPNRLTTGVMLFAMAAARWVAPDDAALAQRPAWSAAVLIFLGVVMLALAAINMMAVRQIGPATAEIFGGPRTVIIYVVSSACGFILSSLAGAYMPALPIIGGAPATLGASAAIFGLVGALMYYGRRSGSSVMTSQLTSWVMSMVIFGLVVPRIDNYAHAGGFAGGYLLGMWLDPLKPERVSHVIGALICLVATVAACGAWFILLHRKAHLDPAWAREHVPWHFDHHMGPDQDQNWGIALDWYDRLAGTRVRYVGTAREAADQARQASRAAKR
jgi:membrane associated rhomboid family serine protease